MPLLVLADAASNTAWGAVGLLGSATIAGWFSLRANHQEKDARATKEDTTSLGSEVAQALTLVHDLVAQAREKDAEITRLQRLLDECRRSRRR